MLTLSPVQYTSNALIPLIAQAKRIPVAFKTLARQSTPWPTNFSSFLDSFSWTSWDTSSWTSWESLSSFNLPSVWLTKEVERLEALSDCLSEVEQFKVTLAIESWQEVELWEFFVELRTQTDWYALAQDSEAWVSLARRIEVAEPRGKIAQYCRLMDRLSYLEDESFWGDFMGKIDDVLSSRVQMGRELARAREQLRVNRLGLMPDGRQVFDMTVELLERLKQR